MGSKLETEILTLTKLSQEPGELRPAFLLRTLQAGQKFQPGSWRNLSKPAKQWYNKGVTTFNRTHDANDILDFDELDEPFDRVTLVEAPPAPPAAEQPLPESHPFKAKAPEPEPEPDPWEGEGDPEGGTVAAAVEAEEEPEPDTFKSDVETEIGVEEEPYQPPVELPQPKHEPEVEAAKGGKPKPASKPKPSGKPAPKPAAGKKTGLFAVDAKTNIPEPDTDADVIAASRIPLGEEVTTVPPAAYQPGASTMIKRLLCRNPQITNAELHERLTAAQIDLSPFTISTIRSDFRHSIRVLQEHGICHEISVY